LIAVSLCGCRFLSNATPAFGLSRSLLAFWLAERRVIVRAIVDRWLAPRERWFKVDADNGHVYVLRHDELSGDWDIAAFAGGAD